jgi:hypothetical protein
MKKCALEALTSNYCYDDDEYKHCPGCGCPWHIQRDAEHFTCYDCYNRWNSYTEYTSPARRCEIDFVEGFKASAWTQMCLVEFRRAYHNYANKTHKTHPKPLERESRIAELVEIDKDIDFVQYRYADVPIIFITAPVEMERPFGSGTDLYVFGRTGRWLTTHNVYETVPKGINIVTRT